MEKVTLNNVQLDILAKSDPELKPYFYGTIACDELPSRPRRNRPQAYIVNTDPAHLPGRHWISLWTECGNVCEVMDSYALPLDTYKTTQPLKDWLTHHWKYVVENGQSLQSPYSQSCGDYALFYLKAKARGHSMNEFLNRFSKHDYVDNDHQIGQMLKSFIVKQLNWKKASKTPFKQDTASSRRGMRDLL